MHGFQNHFIDAESVRKLEPTINTLIQEAIDRLVKMPDDVGLKRKQ